ncbi:hypothetical protein ASG89_25145 [Paenibacillus sp. Soil766]|nr:hypothetical protein ASG89_25145 [Paenibacillus sp. Soil766]
MDWSFTEKRLSQKSTWTFEAASSDFHFFLREFFFTSFGKCRMLFNMLLLHSGHSGVKEVASSSRIQALQSLSLHRHIGTGDNSGFVRSDSILLHLLHALTYPIGRIFIQTGRDNYGMGMVAVASIGRCWRLISKRELIGMKASIIEG